MKKIPLLTGALCAIASGALAQSAVNIRPFENRFGGIHQQVVVVNTIDTGPAIRTFGGSSTFVADPAARGVVTSPATPVTRVTRMDPTAANVPVFPGDTAILMQQGALGFGPFGQPIFPQNAGFGNTGFFIQQGTGQSLVEVDPFRTTATPGPAVNAVPNPAAPTPTIPQIQPTTGTTIPVQAPNPPMLVPGQALPGQTLPGQAVPGGNVIPGGAQQIQPQNTPGQVGPNR